MSFNFGSDSAGWGDIPAASVSVDHQEIGGRLRGTSGRDNRDRHAVKRVFTFQLKPWAAQAVWARFWILWRKSAGPYNLLDSSAPNWLPETDVYGKGWMTAAGVAIPPQANMWITVNGTYTSAQTAKTTSPALSDLIPVDLATTYTAAVSFLALGGFAGTWAVYGYNGATGSGTLLSTTNVALSGRYKVLISTGTYTHIALRLTRTSGTGVLYDPALAPGVDDPGPAIVQVFMDSLPHSPNSPEGKKASLTLTLSEV